MEKVFTIGHSNYALEHFLELLAAHHIDVIVDVRSSPFSKYSPHFNQDNLKLAIKNAGRKYLYLGRELGGMPKDSSYYDDEGYVLYWKLAESPLFVAGIERLRKGIASYTVALMCGEENPSHCHRRLLVGRALGDAGVSVLHIRSGVQVQTESELQALNGESTMQMTLFAADDLRKTWRSSHPVLRNSPSSSNAY
jgi:uncharacterized protein (DUF488 family)